MPRGLPKRVRLLLEKARHSALLAVETYNRPGAPFRTFGYIVLMQIAWTSLLHAIFLKRSVKPYYRKRGGRRFEIVDGEPKRWELLECVSRYWASSEPASAKNLRFMCQLRNRIEHRELPSIDIFVLGECQAMLFNFEALIDAEFGPRYSINESLVVPLQLSRIRAAASGVALHELIRPLPEDLLSWVRAFRSSLTQEEVDSPEYSFRVLLIPEVKNNPTRDALPVEFVHYRPGEDADLDRAFALIKRAPVPVVNQGFLKPSKVVAMVAARLPHGTSFTVDTHTRCWRYFAVRPRAGDPRPENCRQNYCLYDAVHGDYVYTQGWVEFLVSELSKPGRIAEVTGGNAAAAESPAREAAGAGSPPSTA